MNKIIAAGSDSRIDWGDERRTAATQNAKNLRSTTVISLNKRIADGGDRRRPSGAARRRGAAMQSAETYARRLCLRGEVIFGGMMHGGVILG